LHKVLGALRRKREGETIKKVSPYTIDLEMYRAVKGAGVDFSNPAARFDFHPVALVTGSWGILQSLQGAEIGME
jgi:hypothetical protein